MKAKLIKSLRVNGKIVSPQAASVVLVDLEEDEFERLSDMGKVAKPTSDELKIGKLVGEKVEDSEGGKDDEQADPNAVVKGRKPKAATAPTGNDNPAGGDTNLDI